MPGPSRIQPGAVPQAYVPGQAVAYVSPGGPDEFGNFGAKTSVSGVNGATGGIQEAMNAVSAAGGGTVWLRADVGPILPANGIYLLPNVKLGSIIETPRKATPGTGFTYKPDIVLPSTFVGIAPFSSYSPPSGGGASTTVFGTNPTLNVYATGYGIGYLSVDCRSPGTSPDLIHLTNIARAKIDYLTGVGCASGLVSDTYPVSSPTPGESGQIGVTEGIEISGHSGVGIDLQYSTQFGGVGLIESVNGGTIGLRIQSSSKCFIGQLQCSGYSVDGIVLDDANNTCANNIVDDFFLGGGATLDINALFSGAKSGSVGNILSNGITGGGATAFGGYPAGSPTSVQTRYLTMRNVVGVTDQSFSLPFSQPSVPSSTTRQYNHYPFPVKVYVQDSTASVTALAVDGATLFTQSAAVVHWGAVTLQPESYIVLTYSSTAPTWNWQAEL